MLSSKSHFLTKPIQHHSNLPLFFTHTTVCNPNPQKQPLEEQNITTNTSYWTKKIHKLCTIDRNVNEAIRLLNHLTVNGYTPNSLNLTSITHALCDSNRFAEAHRRFLSSLNGVTIPDERTCNVIIARLLDWNKKPHFTLNVVYRIMGLKPCFVPSLMNFNRFIDQFCGVSCVGFGHLLLFHMKCLGHCPNVVSYTSLINGYCKIGEMGNARKVFDEMCESGIRPNALTFSVLIRGCLRKRDFEGGNALFGKMWKTMGEEEDRLINHAAFSNVICSLCEEGLFKEVFDIAENMPQGKSVDDGFAYGQMIDSFCRYGRHHGASRIVYMMRKRGCVPSLVSYNSIVHGLAKHGGYLRAYQLLEQGVEIGYVPSEITYKVLIECLCLEEDDLGKAKKLLEIMLNKNGVDKARIYNIYLGALCRMKTDVSTELLNTLVTMLETKCHPDVVTLNTVINGFCKMGKVDEGIKVLEDMIMGKFNDCTPDSVTFTTIISGLLNVGRAQEALDVLTKVMPEKGFNPSVITYNVVLCGLFKLNLSNEAMDVFNSMVGGGVVRDCTTHAIMIDGLCECSRVDDAKVFWEDIIWPSGVHDSFVYSAILKGLCCSGKFNEAWDFVYELVDCGVKLNVINYNILIEGGCKFGMKKEVYLILGEMKKNGVAPDAVTWRIIHKLHKQSKQLGLEENINM
uniref:pentatricopeptide repeat-containing protein At3g18020 n=1 Tax=Erigeron canadensis TaxID=72917 RepID=UPI001CB945EE|nr:pentatricopeptide repeat-containing protein At3g18020 [Erigeron canadensis]